MTRSVLVFELQTFYGATHAVFHGLLWTMTLLRYSAAGILATHPYKRYSFIEALLLQLCTLTTPVPFALEGMMPWLTLEGHSSLLLERRLRSQDSFR
jgi:hypothetical protein